jgi:hypothetical protein
MKWERGAEGGAMQRQPSLNQQAGFATGSEHGDSSATSKKKNTVITHYFD